MCSVYSYNCVVIDDVVFTNLVIQAGESAFQKAYSVAEGSVGAFLYQEPI